MGLDLAKNVFQVHGVSERGRVVLRKHLRRDRGAPFFANLTACLVGMKACSSAHRWARKLESMGHTARLAPQFVKPYVKSNKNGAADAEAVSASCPSSLARLHQSMYPTSEAPVG
jgi:transposase